MPNWLKNKNNKKWLLAFVLSLSFLGIILSFDFAFAQQDTLGLQAVEQSNLNLAGGDLRITIGKIIRAILGFLGIIAVGIVLYGGFTYMTAAGDQEKVTRARKILINGTIGLAIILASFLIVHFIIGRLSQAIFGGVENQDCSGLGDCGGGPSCPGCGPGENCFMSNVFVARSITPNQDSTGMNNIVVRGVFTQPVATPADQIFTVTRNGQNITNNILFSFVPIENEDHQKKVVEGIYIAKDDENNGFCEDPVSGDCFPADNAEYEVIINDGVVSESGLGIDGNNGCGVSNAKFTVDIVKDDINKPTFNHFKILAPDGKEYNGSNIKLPAGRTYLIQAEVQDDSGIGYVHFQVSSNDGTDSLERYDGPKNSAEPYLFQKTIFIGTGMPLDVVYSAVATAFDIDHNSEVASLQFSVAPAHCANGIQDIDKGETEGIDLGGPCGGDEGGSCASNLDCADGLVCGPDNTCIGTPVITDVSPSMDGAQGNWITILGKYFGTTPGSIQFALNNGDSIYEEDDWVDADIAECGSTETWKNSYVIAEVPYGFSVGDLASIRIKRSLGQSQASLPVLGKSVSLDGVDDYIFAPSNSVFNLTKDSELTLSAWVKPKKYGRTEIIRKGRYGTYNAYGMWTSFEQGKEDQGKINCYFHPSSQPGIYYQAEGTGLKFGQWNQIVCRRIKNLVDGKGKVEVFVNGQPAGQSNWGVDMLPAVENNDELFFGGIGLGASYTVNPFEGNLDEFSVFSNSLTNEQIADLYNAGMHGSSIDYTNKINEVGSLLAHWAFDEETGIEAQEEIQDLNAQYAKGVLVGEPGIFSSNENILVSGNEVFLVDNTTNDVGPKPGPKEGLFEFNNIVRPGLCSVEVLEDYTTTIDGVETTFNQGSLLGPPGAPILAQGNGFGGNSELWFGDSRNADVLGVIFNDQGLDKMTSEVPANLQSGIVGVFVREAGEQSNGVPFTIAQTADEAIKPDIVTIDPSRATPGSYITLYGSGFGDIEGKVYVADSQANVLTCGKENEHQSCFQLNTNDFPPQCGSNLWTDRQVIAEIPQSLKELGFLEERETEVYGDLLLATGVAVPHNIKTADDIVTIGADLLPGDGGKYNMNAEWNMLADLELKENLDPGETAIYGIWGADTWKGLPPVVNISALVLFIQEQKNDEGLISSSVIFSLVNKSGNIVSPIEVPFERTGNKVSLSVDNSFSGDSFVISVKNEFGQELGRIQTAGYDWPPLEEGTMKIGRQIEGYPLSEMLINKFGIATLEKQSINELNVRLKRYDNQATDGDDMLTVYDDSPLPSICRLEPTSGPAPLPEGDEGLKLYGVNFPLNPVIYFWQSGAQFGDITTWLSSEKNKYKDQQVIKSSSDEEVVTLIPYDEATGYTMQTGPIKIGDLNKSDIQSNFATYAVSDCVDAEPIPGFQCCTEGVDAGRWKPDNYTCAGEVKNAGYVWRFTTGLIPLLPQVVEHCNQENWSVDDEYPSPIPWQEWKQGTNVCLNASIAVRFNMEMSKESINSNTVKVFNCGQGTLPDCDMENPNTEIADMDEDGNFVNFEDGGQILEIKKGTWDGENPLAENTWYRIVLYDGIVSVPQDFGIGREESVSLKKTRPLEGVNSTAYYYDFKTGIGFCTLQSVGIYPPEKTASILGQIMADYKLILPFYYVLSGKADQECTMLDVKGMGWNWTTEDSAKQPDQRRAEVTEKTDDDTKASAEALINAPEGVEIRASAPVPTDSQLQAIFQDADSIDAKPSILYISLGDPKAEYWEPECETACRNSSILIDFNRQMSADTYPDGFHIYQCLDSYDPDCTSVYEITDIVKEDFATSTDRQLVFIPSFLFDKNTRYKVELTEEIKALERLEPPLSGKGLSPLTWYFKTQDNEEPCKPAKLDLIPDPFVAHIIGEKTKYLALPRQNPDECSKYGQLLDPNDYDYSWSVNSQAVAEITNYKLGHAIAPYCTGNCLKRGSDIYSTTDVTNLYLCGNGVVDPGEDCDIAGVNENNGQEVSEVSCSLNCLRPGNTNTGTCGNGIVDFNLGEQCDPEDQNTGDYCNPENCLLIGAEAQTEVGACGDGSWTYNEACDRGLLLENIGDPEKSRIGCNEQCLHVGTKSIASFCQNVTKQKNIEICKNALSVCGNGILELGEECENPESPECSTSCTLIGNACGTVNQQCSAGVEGCDKNCILLGSSASYFTPSVCGDGNVGIGENADCELEASLTQSLGAGPVQIVTAIGDGVVDADTGKQETDIFAQLLTTSISGSAKYSLQCGYEEYPSNENIESGLYNNCPNNSANNLGVAQNSCCVQRPRRISEYPKDLSGLEGGVPICPNTQISATFDHEINENSLFENITIVKGFETEVDCVGADVTDKVNNALALGNLENGKSTFFWRIWNSIKGFFVRIFGGLVHAGEQKESVSNIKTWCQTSIATRPEIHNQMVEIDGKTTIVSSTVLFNIQSILDPESVYAIVLEGGKDGVKDVAGVGIKHAALDNPSINDVWVFKTGEKACELDAVWIEPAAYLFQSPRTSQNFLARAISFSYEKDEGREIVQIPGGYDWSWDWGPKDSPLFAIPADGTADSSQISIASTDLEGSITARAIATIITDSAGNTEGKRVIGATQLVSNFCERLWPPISAEDGTWKSYEDNRYNFRMSYCADAGLSGTENIGDDLPYLDREVKFLTQNTPTEIRTCQYGGNICQSDADCSDNYYHMRNAIQNSSFLIDQILYSETGNTCVYKPKGSDSTDYGTGFLLDGTPYVSCETDSDCGPLQHDLQLNEENEPVCVSIYDNSVGDRLQNYCQNSEPINEDFFDTGLPTEGILKKLIFFNDKNEDLFGLQVLTNDDRLPIREWFSRRFDSSSQLQSLSIAGHEALTDGNTYYVNAMNIEDTKNPDLEKFYRIYNNIYIFSVNDQAQADTREVLEQLVESLEFNINMGDEGYCLNVGADLHRSPLDYNSNYSCDTDFDCLDSDGNVLNSSLSGVCSSAKRKFDRDISRLQDIQSIQSRLELGPPSLEGGTYIPGYTVSRWPSWSREDGLNMSGYLDPLNVWTSCEGESQTCWNGESLEFYCPKKISVYEYVYNPETKNYDLFTNLEYFPNEKEDLVKEFFQEYITSPESLTLGRHCVADEKYTPHASSCGDGVIGLGEQCDPPGRLIKSTIGYSAEVEGSCDFAAREQVCYTDVECASSMFFSSASDAIVPYQSGQKVCAITVDNTDQRLLYGDSPIHETHGLAELSVFTCQTNSDCVAPTIAYDGDINLFGSSYTISDKTQITEDTFDCVELGTTEGYSNGAALNCVGGKASDFGACPIGETASSICSDSCSFNYGVCRPPNECGNGMTESGEVCDDGNLNGTYGHCANDCQGEYPDYCGDGIFQKDFEFCDWSKDDKSIWAQNKEDSCSFNCKDYGSWCGDGVRQPDNEECDDKNDVRGDGCSPLCVEENKACLDKLPQTFYDKVGDKTYIYITRLNQSYFDLLNSNLYNLNQMSFQGGEEHINECFADSNGDEICSAAGLACAEVAKYTDTCTVEIIPNSFPQETRVVCTGDLKVSKLGCLDSLNGLYSPSASSAYYFVKCSGKYLGEEYKAPSVSTGEMVCGNGTIENEETHPEGDSTKWEECDFGDKNGFPCSPSYGKSCTYCSEGCKTIRVEPEEYCGDNVLNLGFEKCDKIDGKVVSLPLSGFEDEENVFQCSQVNQQQVEDCKYLCGPDGDIFACTFACGFLSAACLIDRQCGDKGEWTCTNECQEINNNCVDCKEYTDGIRPKATLSIINPMVKTGDGNQLPEGQFAVLFRKESASVLGLLKYNYLVGGNPFYRPLTDKYEFTTDGKAQTNNKLGIETNLLCSDEYKLIFENSNSIENVAQAIEDVASLENPPQVFDYDIAAEENEVYHEYVYSPAVPAGVFRVVVRWTGADADRTTFLGGIYRNAGAISMITYDKAHADANICDGVRQLDNLWWPTACQQYDSFVYIHPQNGLQKTYIQSFTIDTRELPPDENIGFFVQSISTDRIAAYKLTGLRVDIYEERPGQNLLYSVYKPTKSFPIVEAANTSTNQIAKYWHVFNFGYNSETEKYVIEKKQTIETNECQLKESVLDAQLEECNN